MLNNRLAGATRVVLGCALALGMMPVAIAATVSVNPTNSTAPVAGGGTTPTPIAITFAGDGTTVAFQVDLFYDTAVLDATVAGANGGSCTDNNGLGRVRVLRTDPDNQPLPNGPTTYCNVTFTVAAQPDGTVLALDLTAGLFSNAAGNPSPGPHILNDGTITVQSTPVPLTLAYSPAAGSTITFGAGNVGAAATAQTITATATGNSGTASLTACAITGTGASAFSVAPTSLNFAAAGSQNLSVGCTYQAGAATATLTCTETDADSAGVARAWPLSCPAGTVVPVNPTISSVPASGSTINVSSASVGTLGTFTLDLVATGGAGAGSRAISCSSTGNVRIAAAPGTPTTTGPITQTVTGAAQPSDLRIGVTLTSAAQPAAGTVTCTVSGQADLVYTVTAPAGSTFTPPEVIPSASTWSKLALFGLLGLFGVLAVGFRRS
jgi:hypothetical protein